MNQAIGHYADLAEGLRKRRRDWLFAFAPAGREEGGMFLLGDPYGADGRSLPIPLDGSQEKLSDFAGEWHGDDLDLVAALSFNGDLDRAAEWARGFLAVDRPSSGYSSGGGSYQSKSREEKHEGRRKFLARCEADFRNTVAATYLESREIRSAPPNVLLFAPSYSHPRAERKLPALICPVRDNDDVIVAYQAIYLAADGTGKADVPEAKRTYPLADDWASKGAFRLPASAHEIRTEHQPHTAIAISEGPEDALSVRWGTGLETWASFGVKHMWRMPFPAGRRVIVCADNDEPGSDADRALKVSVGKMLANGLDVWIARAPHPHKDMNALLMAEGKDAVLAAVEAGEPAAQALGLDAPGGDQRSPPLEPENGAQPPDRGEQPATPFDEPPEPGSPNSEQPRSPEHHPRFAPPPGVKPLGHNAGRYYYFSDARQQVEQLSPSGHSYFNLISLNPNDWAWRGWIGADEKTSSSKLAERCAARLIDQCHRRGVFSPELVRGVGTWRDGDGYVINLGDRCIADGAFLSSGEATARSRFVYESRRALSEDAPTEVAPLAAEEATTLLDIFAHAPFAGAHDAELLAGWVVAMHACGALKWRPHVWIVGAKGSGKSTIVEDMIKPCLGPLLYTPQGGTTEAAIRAKLGSDARPVWMDEAEPTLRDRNATMTAVLKLARVASSGGTIDKGTPDGSGLSYLARFGAGFCSINTSATEAADVSRITTFRLRSVKERTADDEARQRDRDRYDQLKRLIAGHIDGHTWLRLAIFVARNLSTLMANIETYRAALLGVVDESRQADQLAPLLAGARLLRNVRLLSVNDARTEVAALDLYVRDTASNSNEDDGERFWDHLLSRNVRYSTNDGLHREDTVSELIHQTNTLEPPADKVRALGNIGIKWVNARSDGHWIAPMLAIWPRCPRLQELLQGTPWAADCSSALKSHPAVVDTDRQVHWPTYSKRRRSVTLSRVGWEEDHAIAA